MNLIISNSSSIPIYEQIKQGIINEIITGSLETDEPLPSIRSLASDIHISIMTIKKAYDELENEGYIKTIQGKGSFVSPKNLDFIKEQKQKEIEEYITKIILISKQYNIPKKEIIETLNILYESGEE